MQTQPGAGDLGVVKFMLPEAHVRKWGGSQASDFSSCCKETRGGVGEEAKWTNGEHKKGKSECQVETDKMKNRSAIEKNQENQNLVLRGRQ
jgi:hypothetical protein